MQSADDGSYQHKQGPMLLWHLVWYPACRRRATHVQIDGQVV